MKSRFFLSILIFVFLGANAQTGYLGRRAILNADMGLNMNFYKENAGILSFVTQYGLGGGYITGDHTQANFTLSYYQIKDFRLRQDSVTNNVLGFHSDKVSAMELQMAMRFYPNRIFRHEYGSLAPVGIFFEAGPALTFTHYIPGELSYLDVYYTKHHLPIQHPDDKRMLIHVFLGGGAQHVYYDKLVLSARMLASLPVIEIQGKDKIPDKTDYKEFVSYHHALMVHFGIGLLL